MYLDNYLLLTNSSVDFKRYSDIFLPVKSITVSFVFNVRIGGRGPYAPEGHCCLPDEQEHDGKFLNLTEKFHIMCSKTKG